MKSTFDPLKNNRGQAVVAALILLPIILALFVALALIGGAISIEARATAACRSALLESQSTAAEALANLLRLNPIAHQLETTRRAAKLALQAAIVSGFPQAIAAARIAVEIAETAQLPIMIEQKRWLIQGRIASFTAPEKAMGAIHKSLPLGLTSYFKSELFEASTETRHVSRRPKFAILASPPGARTPTYRTPPLYEKSQEARVQWLLSLSTLKFSSSRSFALKGDLGCSMTLVKNERSVWSPKITADKLLQN